MNFSIQNILSSPSDHNGIKVEVNNWRNYLSAMRWNHIVLNGWGVVEKPGRN